MKILWNRYLCVERVAWQIPEMLIGIVGLQDAVSIQYESHPNRIAVGEYDVHDLDGCLPLQIRVLVVIYPNCRIIPQHRVRKRKTGMR